MNPLLSIGRTGAAASVDGVAATPGTHLSSGASFGKSLEYVIDAHRADQQRYVGGIGGQTTNTQQISVATKAQPLTPRVTVSGTQPNAASVPIRQQPLGRSEPQSQPGETHGYGLGTPGGGQPDTGLSTLDPRSMAFLIAWMGGTTGSEGPSIRQQQQNYLDFYRQHYPNGVPGGSGPASATLNFLTGTS